jgi:hypothetical protein
MQHVDFSVHLGGRHASKAQHGQPAVQQHRQRYTSKWLPEAQAAVDVKPNEREA